MSRCDFADATGVLSLPGGRFGPAVQQRAIIEEPLDLGTRSVIVGATEILLLARSPHLAARAAWLLLRGANQPQGELSPHRINP